MHLVDPVPKLNETCEGLKATPKLQALIEKAMAKRSAQRFAHAMEMRATFQALPRPIAKLEGRRGRDAHGGLVERMMAWFRRVLQT